MLKKGFIFGMLFALSCSFEVQAADCFSNISINRINVNGLTPQEAAALLNEQCLVNIAINNDTSKETLTAETLGAWYDVESLTWICDHVHGFAAQAEEVFLPPVCNSDKLRAAVHALNTPENPITTEDARLRYDQETAQFIIQDEVQGNLIDEELLMKTIRRQLRKHRIFSLTLEDFLIKPGIVHDDCMDAMDAANLALQTRITVSDGVQEKTLDKDTLLQTGILSEYGSIDKDAISAFVEGYDFRTTGLEREITSPATGVFKQDGGVFFSTVDKEKEARVLASEIEKGIQAQRLPMYQISLNDNGGIGDTFIEVSIENQKVYLIRDGEIEYTADCVSGCPATGHDTPKGICYINSKYRGITLARYNSYVNYWMAFIGTEYGLHDASWRSEFGGSIYENNGSHGCVNMYEPDVAYFYDNTEIGIPIVVH